MSETTTIQSRLTKNTVSKISKNNSIEALYIYQDNKFGNFIEINNSLNSETRALSNYEYVYFINNKVYINVSQTSISTEYIWRNNYSTANDILIKKVLYTDQTITYFKKENDNWVKLTNEEKDCFERTLLNGETVDIYNTKFYRADLSNLTTEFTFITHSGIEDTYSFVNVDRNNPNTTKYNYIYKDENNIDQTLQIEHDFSTLKYKSSSFNFVCIGYSPNGYKKFVAENNIQNNISWDELSNGGVCTGDGIRAQIGKIKNCKIRLINDSSQYKKYEDLLEDYNISMSTPTQITDGTVQKYITESSYIDFNNWESVNGVYIV